MPLGFAKDILPKGAAGGAAVPTSYFYSSGTTSEGANGANLVLDRGSGNIWNINQKKLTGSIWFKGVAADIPSASDNVAVFRMQTDNDEGIAINIRRTGWDVVIQERNYGNALFQCNPANFSTNFLDNNWHHFVFEYGAVSGSQNGRGFLDGVDRETTDGTDNITQAITNNRYMYFNGNPLTAAVNNGTYRDSDAGLIEFSQVWLDISKDYNIASNLTKFYNNGWVDMGTDGTGTGLTKPDIFLRVSGGAIVNSGSVSATVVEVAEGSGGWTKV